jgi:hypothetical protein
MSLPKHVYKKFEVEKFKIEQPEKGSKSEEPFVRVSVDGRGCPLVNCNCSPENYISLSDGTVGLTVALTASQAKAIREGLLCLGED